MNHPKYIADFSEQVGILKRGRFIVERSMAGVALQRFSGVEIFRLETYRPLRIEPEMDPKGTILFVRPGGHGDMLFLTPTLRALKLKYPKCKIQVACHDNFAPVLHHNPDVDQILPYPVPENAWMEADRHVWLERILEDGKEPLQVNAIDLIAMAAGVKLEDKTIRLELTPLEKSAALQAYPKTELPRVGIQVEASVVSRDYPPESLIKVAYKLRSEGCEVMLFGYSDRIEADPEFINLTKLKLEYRQSCALVDTCDAFIAPDSSLCHVAGALGIPTVGLYGPFPARLRTAYQATTVAIDGFAPCAPCHHHGGSGLEWPSECPGNKTGQCAALANIDPKRVIATVMRLLSERS